MRIILLGALALFWSCLPTPVAAAAGAPGLALDNYGVYAELDLVGRELAADSSSGSVAVVSEYQCPQPSRVTDRIVAAPGVRFGFSFIARNRGAEDVVPVTIRVTHPPMQMPDGRTVTVDSWQAYAQGIARLTGWQFEHAHELVPGTWTIAVLHEGEVAVEKSFEVSVADQAP